MILENQQIKHQIFNAWLNSLLPKDANGNISTKIASPLAWAYTYDPENRLTQLSKTDPIDNRTFQYAYDPFGRRIEYKVIAGNQTTISKYLYDNEDIAFITDGSNTVTHAFVHGPGIDEPLAFTDVNNTPYFYLYDGLGSVVGLTDNNQHVAERYDYDSFGRYLGQGNNAIKQPYTFTGREYDQESGLYYYRARYYDPTIGRFISRDPISNNNPDLVSSNVYSYVENNPVTRTDPMGLWYIDVNGSVGFWGGITAGFLIGSEGFYYYVGGGIVTPLAGLSLTYSPNNPTVGLNAGAQAGFGIGGQAGYSYEDGKEPFREYGLVTPGVSVTVYEVFKVQLPSFLKNEVEAAFTENNEK